MRCCSSRAWPAGFCRIADTGIHALDWLSNRYRRGLTWSVKRPFLVIGVTLAIAAVGAVLFTRLQTGFLPEMDEGGYIVDYWTPDGTSLPETDRMLRRVEDVLDRTPEVASFARRTGAELGMFATPQNTGDIVVKLKPRSRSEADGRRGHRRAARHLRERRCRA